MARPRHLGTVSPSLLGSVRGRFLRLTIARKMLLGYLTLVVLIFLISAFAISTLERLNALNRAVINIDLPLIEDTERMIDVLISEELYSRRSAILKSPEMLELSQEKSSEFERLAARVRSLTRETRQQAESVVALHAEYRKLLERTRGAGGWTANESLVRAKQEKIIGLLKEIAGRAHQDQNERVMATSLIGSNAFSLMILLCIASIIVSMAATVFITKSIAGPVARLKQATASISEGSYDLISEVRNQDELGDLSNAFNEMILRLKRLEEMHLDASPLTRLPGNAAIETVLKKRLENDRPLAFCHIDMDNFKAFNDRYGYAKGSEIILVTARIIEQCAAELGTPDDFVGHIGGDDFVLISTPDRFKDICTCIIETFDRTIPGYYDVSDRQRGFILGKSRSGEPVSFPIMSISIAVVTNIGRRLASSLQVGELAAELKEYAKSIPGSVYVVDRRRENAQEEAIKHA